MGQTLSVPATDKTSETGGDERFLYAVSEMQGWRISMEDAHAAVLNLDDNKDVHNSFFAVYDGHGGSAAAKFAGQGVHNRLIREDAYREKQWALALKRAFLGADEELRQDPSFLRDPSGCTAVAGLVTHDRKLVVANAGDSRAVLSCKGEVKPMSYDHKPQSETEKSRILSAGGYVEYGRVNGNLALSRALGDFEYKRNGSLEPEAQIITADPDIIEHQLTDEEEFFVVACDGIWDCLTSQQVVDIVRQKVAEGMDLETIASLLCDHCLAPDTTAGAGIGCDNMTVLIVALLNGKSKDEWYAWVKDRVERKHGYDTPADMPRIFAESRILAFQARQKAQSDRDERDRGNSGGAGPGGAGGPIGSLLSAGALGGFARVLGSSGGISFHPGSGIISDTGSLMFGKYDDDDSDEDMIDGSDEDGEVEPAAGFFGDAFDDSENGASGAGGSTRSLRAQIAELESDEDAEVEKVEDTDMADGVTTPKPATGPTQGEAPPPPPASATSTAPQKQLETKPGGDELSPAVKAEGLLDKSEDPTRSL